LSSGQESSPDCKPDVDGLADTDAVKPLTAKKLAALSKGHSCDCTFLVGPSSEEAQVRKYREHYYFNFIFSAFQP